METPNEATPEAQAKRVFILGAGFSKPAGLPLATELTDDVLNELRKLVGDEYELFKFARHIRELHQWMNQTRGMSPLNIEEFYNYATTYIERLRLDQHLQPVGRDAGETADRQARDIEAWLSYLDEYLLDVLIEYERKADLDPIRRFADVLRPSDAIVTFNYDRLVERALGAQGIEWTLGFNDASSKRIAVLKLHGSMDWICLERDKHHNDPGLELLFTKRDSNRERNPPKSRTGEVEYDFELLRINNDDRLQGLIKDRHSIQVDHFWGLAGLGPQKRISQVPGLAAPWAKARRAIYEAEVIVIVGFSFSGYDRLAQIEFARVMAGREKQNEPAPRIVVIDPIVAKSNGCMHADGLALMKRIESVFRPAECVGVGHETYDWQLVG